MIRLYKPARLKRHNRGLFSYLSESVVNMSNFIYVHNDFNVKYYHDLFDIPGYGEGNVFDLILMQDTEDYQKNIDIYQNIENFEDVLKINSYSFSNFKKEIRLISESVINNFFVPNEEILKLMGCRWKEIDFNKTIGVHRRATDIGFHHNIISLKTIFDEIDSSEFDNIFLMCDNISDLKKFQEKYGNKLITFDTFTSQNLNSPFFKNQNTIEQIQSHVKELLFGVFTFSKTKKFICSKSNIASFSILANSNLDYKLLVEN